MRRAINHRPPARRGGVTLTEVLMATMLMGIGVVTLATLFPISIMRSIRATQLTNATILRYNVESLINVDKDLVYAPDASISPTSTDIHYMVDPMGWNRMGQIDTGLRTAFGNNGDSPPTPYEVAGNPGLFRVNNGLNSLQKAVDGVTLPDSWVYQVEGFPNAQPTDAGGGEGQVVLNDLTTADLGGISTASTAPSRIVFFTADNRHSETRTIKDDPGAISGNTITFLGSVPSINVARAVIETQEQRYTWMLTVRRNSSAIATADVVIFFRRPFGIEDETVHTAAFQQHRNKVQITYKTTEKPYLRKGSYVLDVNNARWYQIVNVESETSSSAVLVLDRNAVESSPPGNGGAILMRGIVEVYPLPEIKQ